MVASSARAGTLGAVAAITLLGWLAVHAEARAASPVTPATLAGPGRFAVGRTTRTLVDPKRSTPTSGTFPGSPVRTLVTDVYYPAAGGTPGVVAPDAPLDTRDGRFPLLVFAHGYGSSRTAFTVTLAHLASHGYILAAPEFPLTDNFAVLVGGYADPADLINQPGDVSFEIDTFTGIGDSAGGAFAGVVDGGAVGLLGHSFGGTTTFLAVFGGPLADPRLKAAAAAAPYTCLFGPQMFSGKSLPFLVLHGTSDEFVDPAWSRETYPFMPPPKFLGEIVGGDHLGFETDLGGLRDKDVIAFSSAVAWNAAQQAALAAALIAKVPGADPTRCLSKPPLPNPNAPRDPLIAAAEQLRITHVALTAFFDAFLRQDVGARRYFLHLARPHAFDRELRFCKSTRRSRRCHLPPLSPSGAFLDGMGPRVTP